MTARPASLIANRYQLLAMVGQGGMGIVYRALDRLRGQQVALKSISTLLPSVSGRSHVGTTLAGATMPATPIYAEGDTDTAQQTGSLVSGVAPVFVRASEDSVALRVALAQEFRTLGSLRHPHIITVLDYGFDAQQTPFFTMELLSDARPLLVAARELPLIQRMALLLQVAQALAYLHRRGVLHRDLKPANILALTTPTGYHVKVLDFGLAMVKSQEEPTTAKVVGTIMYMAPELLRGRGPSESADLYSFGVTACELLAERPPFGDVSGADLVKAVLGKPPDVSIVDAPEPLRELLQQLLAKDPAQRPQDASQLCLLLAKSVGLSPPAETVSIRESYLQAATFVARESEVGELMDALSDAVDGRGSGWLVGGESGVGKSRLLEEVRTQALVRGAQVLRGEAVRIGGARYEALRDVLRALSLSIPLDGVQASFLHPLLPDLPSLLQRPVGDPPQLDAKAAQERLLAVISDMFARITQPTVVLIDDIQWAGVEVILTLSHLMRTIWKCPVVLIASYRDDEAPWLPSALPAMEVLKLSRLDRESICALSESMLGPIGREPELIKLLERETEGNAYFMVEVLRSLAEERGMLSQVLGNRLPSKVFAGGMRAVIERRLNRVPESARPLLDLAAVAGRNLDLKILGGLTKQLDTWLEMCANASVLEVVEQSWRFTHEKLRERLLEAIAPERRSTLHRQVAHLIVQSEQGKTVDPLRLAYHYGEAGDAAEAVQYAMQAGEIALAEGAFEEAQVRFDDTLRWEPQLDTLAGRLLMARGQRLSGISLLALGRPAESAVRFRRAWSLLGVTLPEARAIMRPDEVVPQGQLADETLRGLLAELAPLPDGRQIGAEAVLLAEQSLTPLLLLGLNGSACFLCMVGIKLCERFDHPGPAAYFCHGLSLYLESDIAARIPGVHPTATAERLAALTAAVSGAMSMPAAPGGVHVGSSPMPEVATAPGGAPEPEPEPEPDIPDLDDPSAKTPPATPALRSLTALRK